MSKRARITLDPEIASETDADTEPTPAKEAPDRTADDASGGMVPPPGSTPPRTSTLNVGRVIRFVVAGLAVASLVLLWLKKRP